MFWFGLGISVSLLMFYFVYFGEFGSLSEFFFLLLYLFGFILKIVLHVKWEGVTGLLGGYRGCQLKLHSFMLQLNPFRIIAKFKKCLRTV